MAVRGGSRPLIQIPAPIDSNLTIDVISLSDQIRRRGTRGGTLTRPPTEAASFSSVKLGLLVPDISKFSGEERTFTLFRYVSIMSKSNLSGLNVNSAHIGAVILFCGIPTTSNFFDFLRQEGFEMEYLDCEQFNVYLDTLDSDDAKEVMREINQIDLDNREKASRAYMGVVVLLIGKKLTSNGWQKWGTNALRALLGTVGIETILHVSKDVYPSLINGLSFHGLVTTTYLVRAALYYYLKQLTTDQISWQKGLAEAILTRLMWTELGHLRFIDVYLIKTNIYMLLLGDVAAYMYLIRRAFEIFVGYGDDCYWLKLITSPADNPELSTAGLKKVAELGRLVGICLGYESLNNVRTGYTYLDESKMKEKIMSLLKAASQTEFVWSHKAGKYIADRALNPMLYKALYGPDDRDEERRIGQEENDV